MSGREGRRGGQVQNHLGAPGRYTCTYYYNIVTGCTRTPWNACGVDADGTWRLRVRRVTGVCARRIRRRRCPFGGIRAAEFSRRPRRSAVQYRRRRRTSASLTLHHNIIIYAGKCSFRRERCYCGARGDRPEITGRGDGNRVHYLRLLHRFASARDVRLFSRQQVYIPSSFFFFFISKSKSREDFAPSPPPQQKTPTAPETAARL